MKKFTFILVMLVTMFTLTSCATSAMAYETNGYYDDNVVVVDNVCYAYYSNPTTVFLNTLHIIDGAYYYWHSNKYIPVVFPYWEVWSPHRFFYYDRNRWVWRDRYHYNHAQYRRDNHWVDYRKPHHPNTYINRNVNVNNGYKPHNNGNTYRQPQSGRGNYNPQRPTRTVTPQTNTHSSVIHSSSRGHTVPQRSGGRR